MSAELRLDTREFSRAVQELIKATGRDSADQINREGHSIVIAAPKLTYAAEKAKIETTLGAVGYKVKQVTRGKNKGKYRKAGLIVSKSSLAERIVRARLFSKGEQQPTAQDGEAKAVAFIKQMISHINYIRSGWLASVGAFAQATGKPLGKGSQKAAQKGIGGAAVARPGMNPTASFWNSASAKITQNAPTAAMHAAGGLKAAITQQIGRMAKRIGARMQQTANKFNAH